MALDRITTGDTYLPGWACREATPIAFNEWTNALVKYGYLREADLEKLLSASVERWFGRTKATVTNVVIAFAVTEEDPGNTLLFSTRNWRDLAALGVSPSDYRPNGFVVFRKDGNGATFLPRQSASANLIGSGGMHNFLPLR